MREPERIIRLKTGVLRSSDFELSTCAAFDVFFAARASLRDRHEALPSWGPVE